MNDFFEFIFIFSLFILCSCTHIAKAPTSAHKYQPYTYKDPSNGQVLPYELLIPDNYVESKKYPVVIYLHGIGEVGTDNGRQIVSGAEIFETPEMQSKYPAIVIAPQSPLAFGWGTGQTKATPIAQATFDLLKNEIMSKYSVDVKRIYIMGLSMGGMGTWDFASRWSSTFAAALPMSGSTVAPAEKFLKIPIWAIHGAEDPIVPPGSDINLVPEINAAGGKAKLTLIRCPDPACRHGGWPQIVRNPETLDWLFSQSLK